MKKRGRILLSEGGLPPCLPLLSFPDIGDDSRGHVMADDPAGEWLTYDEAAERLGIKSDSVRRRAAARKWQRRQGNDGRARVLVPLNAIPDSTPVPIPVVIPDDPGLVARLAVAEARLTDALQTVAEGRKALDDMKADRDAWKRQAEALASRPGWLTKLLGRYR